ncbi:hypothetical protein LguiB_026554 [Lonicera macranthoides]
MIDHGTKIKHPEHPMIDHGLAMIDHAFYQLQSWVWRGQPPTTTFSLFWEFFCLEICFLVYFISFCTSLASF